MAESVLARLWNAVKPPPPIRSQEAESRQLTPRQKRLLRVAAGAVVLGAAAWGVSNYVISEPQRANQDFQEGMRLMQPATYSQAIPHFDRALQKTPELAAAYLNRGIAYRYLNRNDQALGDFDAALRINPNLSRAYSERGSIFRQRGEANRAIEEFTRALGIEESLDAYYERGQTYESLGEHQKAIADFDSAIAWMRNSPEVYRARSLARRNIGDIAGYEADRDQANTFEQRR
jgi:tetratricopeptide (TPR) repeat protein